MSNDKTKTETGGVTVPSGVQAPKTTADPRVAKDAGIPLVLPEGAILEFFEFSELSKGGQYGYVQDREIPAEVLKVAPYLKGTKKPSLFNVYRGNEQIYLTGATMKEAHGIGNPEKQLKRFALLIIPL
jgi:hypothetical protein